MKSILLKALPHVAAVAIFLILASTYFSPVFDGYSLRQGDINEHVGMSKEIADYRLMNGEEPLWTNSMFGGMPAYQISVIHENNWLRHVDQALKLYMPVPVGILFMAMLGFYIFTLCLRLNPWLGILGGIGFGFATINILYLGAGHVSKVNAIAYMAPALGGLLLATRGKWILGSAIFALFFSLNVAANHLQMTYYLAILLGAVAVAEGIRLLIEKQFGYLVKAASALIVAAGIAILPNMSNLLTTYEYSKFTTRGKTELTIEPDGIEKDQTSIKGLETNYILEYNFGKGEAWSLLLPNAKGGQSAAIGSDKELLQKVPRQFREDIGQSNRYWGEQRYTGGAFYFGAAIMFLFILGLILVKDAIKWPFLILTFIALGLASKDAGGINDFFINNFPMYNKFRDSKMILVIIQVMAPAMAVLFLDRLFKQEGLIGNKKLWMGSVAGIALIGLILLASPSITGPFLSQAETAQFSELESQLQDPKQIAMYDEYKTALMDIRVEIFKADAGRTLLIFLVCGVLVIVSMFKKIPNQVLIGVMAIVVLADQMTVSQRYLNTDKLKGNYVSYQKADQKALPHEPSQADLFILENEKPMVSNIIDESKALLAKMNESHLYQGIRDKEKLALIADFGALNLNSDYRVLSLGNPFNEARTSYFHKSLGGYHGAKLKRYQEMIEFHIQPEMQLMMDSLKTAADVSILGELSVLNMLNTKYIVYNPEAPPIVNPFRNGEAWFVDEIITAADANEEISKLKGIDTKRKAVVHNEFTGIAKATAVTDSTAEVSLVEYKTNALKYQSKNSSESCIIFSEIYYPAGWNCYIDGKEAQAFRANYILRGVNVPAGEHTIEWKFEPATFNQGNTYSLAGSVLLLLLVLGSLFYEIKKKA
jgi:hypothetical protein